MAGSLHWLVFYDKVSGQPRRLVWDDSRELGQTDLAIHVPLANETALVFLATPGVAVEFDPLLTTAISAAMAQAGAITP